MSKSIPKFVLGIESETVNSQVVLFFVLFIISHYAVVLYIAFERLYKDPEIKKNVYDLI
jgi:hypothetical protein